MSDITKTDIYTVLINNIAHESRKIISCLWKDPSLYSDIDLTYEDFKEYDNQWATMFFIGQELIQKEDKKIISEADVTKYLLSHSKCQQVWNSIDRDNPYDRIMKVVNVIPSDNIDSYIEQRQKLIVIKKLIDKKLLNDEVLIKMYMDDMTMEQIYNMYEAYLNDIFIKGVMNISSYNLYDNIEDNLLLWNEGSVMGLSLCGLPNFSQYFGGIPKGSVTLLGGVSNSGKSSVLRNSILPALFSSEDEIEENKKRIAEGKPIILNPEHKTVIFLNEEEIEKWQREILAWIFSNVQSLQMDKNIFKKKGFYNISQMKENITETIRIMKELIPENQILFVPLPKFSTNITIKQIKKYAAMKYENFIIDTFKMDNTDDAKVDNTVRLQLIQNMNHLANVAKKDGGKNVRVICTVQLSKSYTLQRYLSQESLAESKNMIDVCSTGIFIRRVWEDEKIGGAKALTIYDYTTGKELPQLNNIKNYIILFPSKTREGGTDRQCVAEVDWANNTIKEVGYVKLVPDKT